MCFTNKNKIKKKARKKDILLKNRSGAKRSLSKVGYSENALKVLGGLKIIGAAIP
ncbi:MAG: hypothetical protein ACJAZH_001613, partial [Roseivirga sp.]